MSPNPVPIDASGVLAGTTSRWRESAFTTGPVVVFDLDGVLSDAAGRQHFLNDARGRKDWDAFFAACGDDPVIGEVHRLLELLDARLRVVLLSARPGTVVAETLAWLERYEVRWDLLVLRPAGDRRSASRFKRDVLRHLQALGLDVQLGFEDDPHNVAMFHAEGIPCVYLHSGYYEGRIE